MKCLICDKDFEFLGRHLSAHKMSAKEYREKFDIPASQSLTGSIESDGEATKESAKEFIEEQTKPKRPMMKYAFMNRQMKARASTLMGDKSFAKDWASSMQMFWLSKKYGISQSSLYRMESLGYLPERRQKRSCKRC